MIGCGGDVPEERARDAVAAGRELEQAADNVPRVHGIFERYRARATSAAPVIAQYRATGDPALLRQINSRAPGVTKIDARTGRPASLYEPAVRDLLRAANSRPRTEKQVAQRVRRAVSGDIERILRAVKGEPLDASLGIDDQTVESVLQGAEKSARKWWPDLAAGLTRRLKEGRQEG